VARIRTIKPEFPQSESMGRVSREARLLFIMLWTLLDDEGRARGNSRMLASLLFPYDDDAPALIESWISELEAEGCLARYIVSGQTYLQVCNWLIHQKIDKPSKSRIPPFDESSRILANPREVSSEDQGEDLGKEKELKDLSEIEISPIKSPQSKSAVSVKAPAGFERWYASYPKREKRPDAVKAWVKQRCEQIADEVIAGTRRLVSIKGWSAKDQYTPLPASFLNARRWEDDPVPVIAGDNLHHQNAANIAAGKAKILRSGWGEVIEHD
jgi:hypothetical protein